MSNDAAAVAKAVANTQKAGIDASIVTKTLDTLNATAPKTKGKGGAGDMSASYDLQKSVLSAVYSPKGAIAELKS